PAAGGHRAALQRVDGEIDLLPARADQRPHAELLRALGRADHDAAADRQALERVAGAGERRLLGRILVGPAEPARAGERGPLGHAGVALADARAARPGLEAAALARLGLQVGHATRSSRSASDSTSSITAAVDRSVFVASITGTPAPSARPTM